MKWLIILLLVLIILILYSRYTKLEKFIRGLLNKNKYELPNEVILDTERISTDAKRQDVIDYMISLGYQFKRKFILAGQTRLHLFSLGGTAGSLIDLLTKGEDAKTAPAVAKVELEGGLFDDLLHNYLVLFPGQRINFPLTGNLFKKCIQQQKTKPDKNPNRQDDVKQYGSTPDSSRVSSNVTSRHPCLKINKSPFRNPTGDTGVIYNQGNLPHVVKIGLIDSRSDFSQFLEFEDVQNPADPYQSYLDSSDFDGMDLTTPEDHGTMMASIVTSNYEGEGQLKIRNYPFHDGTTGHLMEVIAAIYSAVADSVHIINLSLGYADNVSNGHLGRAIQYAGENDVLVVCAAGNSNSNNDVNKFWPANFSHMNHVVCVGAVDHLGNAWKENTEMGTNFGELSVSFATDGDQVIGFINATDKKQLSGTSCSAAILSALAANVKSGAMAMSASALKTQLLSQIDAGSGIFSLNIPMA